MSPCPTAIELIDSPSIGRWVMPARCSCLASPGLASFENALRDVSGKDITVPYWDWTDPASVGSVFTTDFMAATATRRGLCRDDRSLPPRDGKLVVNNHGLQWDTSATRYLARHFGGFPGSRTPTAQDVEDVRRHDVRRFPVRREQRPETKLRNALEGWNEPVGFGDVDVRVRRRDRRRPARGSEAAQHRPHLGRGDHRPLPEGIQVLGTMTVPLASPNDLVFFLHHANIDRLWAQWQGVNGVHTYEPVSGHEFNNVDDVIHPFDQAGIISTPADVADIQHLGYRYEEPAAEQSFSRAGATRDDTAAGSLEPMRSQSPLFCRIRSCVRATISFRPGETDG